MEILKTEIGEIGYIEFKGRIDASNYKEVEKAFIEYFKQYTDIIMDFSSVEFLDSTGLGSIVACLKYSNDNNGVLKLTGIDRKVKVVFTLTKADKIFEIYPDKETALKAFNKNK